MTHIYVFLLSEWLEIVVKLFSVLLLFQYQSRFVDRSDIWITLGVNRWICAKYVFQLLHQCHYVLKTHSPGSKVNMFCNQLLQKVPICTCYVISSSSRANMYMFCNQLLQ